MDYINVASFVISLALSYIGVPMILNMLSNNDIVNPNYRGDNIPYTMGLSFIFIQTTTVFLIMLITRQNIDYLSLYLIAFVLMGLVGLLDDLIGDKDVKGFRGHIKAFIKGKLTTGGIKAGVGFVLSLFISLLVSRNLIDIIMNIFVISLFTNLINLFDLRPGRSIKLFIMVSIIMLVISLVKDFNFLLYSIYGLLVIYFPMDLKAKVMMGDVGSNVLGITLGIYCVYTQGRLVRAIFLLILIVLHILAERVSFSKVIERSKVLRFIDNLGR